MTDLDPAPVTAEDRAWAAKAQELELGALAAMRASAEKWAAALTSALGVVSLTALLVGPGVFKHLSDGDKKAAEVAFFVAAILTLVAVGLATLAAQAVRTRIIGHSGHDFKRWATRQIDAWHPALLASRWLACAAVVCVFVSAGILWFGDQADSHPTVIDAQGSALCTSGSTGSITAIEGAEYLLRCRK
jgi:hypothetical protein